MSHSPEPWRLEGDYMKHADDELGVYIDEVGLDDCERIVACVNFCRGVTSDELHRAESLSQKYPPNHLGELLDCRQRFRELLNITAERLPK